MKDLIEKLMIAHDPKDPEPDPRTTPSMWVSWFRRKFSSDLASAMAAKVIRVGEWAVMDDQTSEGAGS